MYPALEAVRQEWEEGHRRLEDEVRDPARSDALLAQVEVVTGELRRRLGQTFTLGELAEAYAEAETWSRDAISERAPASGWPRTLAMVQDSAFHLYSRGATDYTP